MQGDCNEFGKLEVASTQQRHLNDNVDLTFKPNLRKASIVTVDGRVQVFTSNDLGLSFGKLRGNNCLSDTVLIDADFLASLPSYRDELTHLRASHLWRERGEKYSLCSSEGKLEILGQMASPLNLLVQFDPEFSTAIECTVNDAVVVRRLPVPLHVSGQIHSGWTVVTPQGVGRALDYVLRPDLFESRYRNHPYWERWQRR